ncbi:MAG TPA: YHYH protein [Candidatus Limnocylindrales bacterium]|nr:YHYH protein [Candidatus Limnocylindrales bacterium]
MKLLLAVCCAAPLFAQPGGGGGAGDGIWRRNAAFGESQTFDACQGHQPQNGQYHYHVNPVCLRAQLNDNLTIARVTRTGTIYKEKSSGWAHSPILGWAQDGYPIYGPYGYSDATNPKSAIQRMRSSFQLRQITRRTSLPDWALPNHSGISQQLAANQYGPDVSVSYPLGRYVEDYDYVAGSGDLDQYNGRTTVTPEFPAGTYAYFVTIDDNGNPVFPYIVAGQFRGAATGGQVQQAPGTLTDYFVNGALSGTAATSPLLNTWETNATKYAQIVSPANPAAGPITTWPGALPAGVQTSGSVTTPALADVQRVRYSSSAVYVNATGLPSYTFGPWFGFANNGGIFANFPAVQSVQFQFPSAPAAASTPTATGLGDCGLWVNGVAVFNFLDGASYSNSGGADRGGGGVAPGVLIVSAASYEGGPTAPGSLVTAYPIFNPTIATSTQAAASANWPNSLGGATVTVRDSAGVSRPAQISYASPGQINFAVPAGMANGVAAVTVSAAGSSTTGSINVVSTYPNLFMLDDTGLAAAYGISESGTVTPVTSAIPAGSYLALFGSGLGSATSAAATIGGVSATVTYAGPQGTYPGLDQYNILIPPALAGKGQVDVVVTAAGLPSNAVYITVQ